MGFFYFTGEIGDEAVLFGFTGPFSSGRPGLLPGVVKGFHAFDQCLLYFQGAVAGLNDYPSQFLPQRHRFNMCRAYDFALAAGGTLVEVLNKIIDLLATDPAVAQNAAEDGFKGCTQLFAFHYFRNEAVLCFGDFQEIDDLAPGNEIFLGILIVDRTPGQTFTAACAGVQLDELFHVQAVQRNFPDILFLKGGSVSSICCSFFGHRYNLTRTSRN